MSLVDWIYPKICVGCGRGGEYICFDCQSKLRAPEAICPMCCKASLDGWVHPRCRKSSGMERLIVGLPYRGMAQECLKKVKYKSSWEIIKFLYGLCSFPQIEESMVTSVPMWKQKERERGFNQAKILAQLLGNNVDLLERVRETKAMFGLSKNDRQININGAFRVVTKDQILGRVIVVDDVWTTGATMRECVKVLKKAGVGEVWGVTLAR